MASSLFSNVCKNIFWSLRLSAYSISHSVDRAVFLACLCCFWVCYDKTFMVRVILFTILFCPYSNNSQSYGNRSSLTCFILVVQFLYCCRNFCFENFLDVHAEQIMNQRIDIRSDAHGRVCSFVNSFQFKEESQHFWKKLSSPVFLFFRTLFLHSWTRLITNCLEVNKKVSIRAFYAFLFF